MDIRNNPVVQATRQYLELFHSDEEISLGSNQVFSYQDDFRALWEKLDNPVSETDREHITVVWDAIPQRDKKVMGTSGADVDTGEYLTPLDWAVAYSLAVDGKTEDSKKYPDLKIFIIDLASEARKTSPAVRFFDMFPRRHVKSMPWIRLLKVIPKDETDWSMSELISNTHESLPMKSINEFTKPALASELDMIRRMWAGAITKTARADDHHAIANILGPQLLLKDSALARNDDHVLALRNLMRSIGLFRDTKNSDLLSDNNHWIDFHGKPWAGKLSRVHNGNNKTKLSLILIDDQWTDGWGEVICKAVGVGYEPPKELDKLNQLMAIGNGRDIEVKAVDSAEWLLTKLEGIKVPLDQRFKFTLDSDESVQEVLFLDLRLYSGRSINDETQFVKRLLKIARNYPATDYPQKLPWPGFTDNELERIKSWAFEVQDKGRDDSRYREALTLLPRIISLIDLSYPIILFSSTGRREVIKHFNDYGNIITTLEKPRLTSAFFESTATQTKAQFISAFDSALNIIIARSLCASLPVKENISSQKYQKGEWTIELYLDERGSEINKKGEPAPKSGITVGGLLAVFPPTCDPDIFDSELRKYLKNEGSLDSEGKDRLRNGVNDIFSFINEKIKENLGPLHLSMVQLSGGMNIDTYSGGEHGFLELERVGDNLHRQLLSAVTEVSIYHHAKRYCPSGSEVSYNIYMPTRVLPAKDVMHSKIMKAHWGVDTWTTKEGKPLLRYFNADSARPLVQSIALNYKWANFRPKAEHARAYGLNRVFDDPSSLSEVRMLHLLADAVLGNKDSDAAKKLKKKGFHGNYDSSFRTLLYAQQSIENGFIGEGFSIGVEAAARASNRDEKDVLKLLAEDMCEVARCKLQGKDFLSIINGLRDLANKKMGGRQKLCAGTVIFVGRGGGKVADENGIEYEFSSLGAKFGTVGVGDEAKFSINRGYLPGEWIANIHSIVRNRSWEQFRVNEFVMGRSKGSSENNIIFDINGIEGRLPRDRCNRFYDRTREYRLKVSECIPDQRRLLLEEIPPEVGMQTKGVVTSVKEFGCFVKFDDGYSGLVHKSNLTDGCIDDINAYVGVDDSIQIEIINVRNDGKIGLRMVRNISRIL